ncbi:PQQ-binding-like beta-propeller repeat protein [Micromonospora sp. NPDC092111]|uniref:outer membrane protein assembly factor BamB family protein n=1 Tax=Micromonospora sp. NPDC092111 TaxID=3364289 RepID=UPI0037F7A246
MTVIDLGELRDDVGPEPPRRPPRAVGRPLRVAVVLVLALSVLAGAAPAVPRAAFVVPARLGASALLHGEQVFLLEPGDNPTGGVFRLSAWTVPASRRTPPALRWQVVVPLVDGSGGMRVHADLLLLTGASGGPDGVFRTFAFERDTGRLRWHQPGSGVEAGHDLLFADYGTEGPMLVHSVDPDTGRVRWSAPMPPEATSYRFAADGVDRIVAAPPPGPVEVWDARRGVRLHSAHLDPGGSPSAVHVEVVGDLLLLVRANADLITGYGVDGLDRRWEVTLPVPSFFTSCGKLICAMGRAGGVRALDPATGRTVWSDARWELAAFERDGRMLASAPGQGIWRPFVVLDTDTGRVVADLGSWNLAQRTTVDGPLLGARLAGRGRVMVAEVDVAAARARVLDVLPAVSGDCQADADLLLCRLVDGAYGVWRLPR